MKIAVVREGDSVDTIAASFQIPAKRLAADNQIEYPYRLAVGQALLIREDEDTEPVQPVKQLIEAGGYAYPFIRDEVIGEALPFLSEVLVFSYGFTREGQLIAPLTPPDRLLREIQTAGKRAVLVLTPMEAGGRFNSELASVLIQDVELQQRLLRAVWEEVQEKGYRGVDLDFEYIRSEDGEGYAAFVARTRELFSVYGIRVSVALAPKTSAEQRGLLYEGILYRDLGEAADQVMLMTYEWGYTYSEPMAVAPIHMVRRVAEYALTEIPREKILLGIPSYGYDWPLPYERGVTKAASLGTMEAIQLAIDHGVPIRFDERSQTPWFRYWQYGVLHEVWFEDVRSLLAKFNLVGELGLKGIMYWQLMRLYRAGYLLLDGMFRTELGGL